MTEKTNFKCLLDIFAVFMCFQMNAHLFFSTVYTSMYELLIFVCAGSTHTITICIQYSSLKYCIVHYTVCTVFLYCSIQRIYALTNSIMQY